MEAEEGPGNGRAQGSEPETRGEPLKHSCEQEFATPWAEARTTIKAPAKNKAATTTGLLCGTR